MEKDEKTLSICLSILSILHRKEKRTDEMGDFWTDGLLDLRFSKLTIYDFYQPQIDALNERKHVITTNEPCNCPLV